MPSLRPYADAAKAAHLMLRGDLSEAISLYEKTVPELPARRRVAWLSVRACFGRALNAAGQFARAKHLLSEALACCPREDFAIAMQHLEPQRQLALADAGLGDHRAAIERLDRLIAAHGHEDNRLLVGLLHQARAEVALQLGDAAGFAKHLAETEQRFEGTRNPALIAAWQQLAEKGVRAKLVQSSAAHPAPRLDGSSWVQQLFAGTQRTLSQLSMAVDRHEYAVKLVMERARARAGYLYLFEGGSMRLCATSSPHEPPRGLESQLIARAERARLEEGDEHEVAPVGEATVMEQAPRETSMTLLESYGVSELARFDDSAESTFLTFLLKARIGGVPTVVGGLILDMRPEDVVGIGAEMLEAIAVALYERPLSSINEDRREGHGTKS
jgi:hypothetical protein